MADIDQFIDEASVTPVVPKRLPKVDGIAKGKRGDSVRETAIAIIENTLRDSRKANDKILQKVDKSSVPVKAVFEAFQTFEAALGGRASLIYALQHCPATSQGYALMQKLLADPDFLEYARINAQEDNVRYSLGVICNRHKIPFNAIVTAFKDAKTAEIALTSLTQVARETPRVVEQLIEDAQNRYVACTVCEGTGRIWRIGTDGEWLLNEQGLHDMQLCQGCRGSGKVFKDHDVQNRKLMLQMAGLIEQNKGSQVNITNQKAIFNGDFLPGDGTFEKIIRAVDVVNMPKPASTDVMDVPYTIYEEDENAKKEESPADED